jgi:3-phytase
VSALTVSTARADVPVEVTFTAPDSADQDDMAIWLHPDDPGLSVVVTSDKANGNIVVHGLDGAPKQTIGLSQPGNIDIRHDVPWGDDCADVIVVNERADETLVAFRVDVDSAELVRMDTGELSVGGNYGFALHLAADGTLYGFTGPEGDTEIRRWTLTPADDGGVQLGESDWSFSASQIEGMVADDDAERVFLGEEGVGIWSVAIADASDAMLVAEIGDASGLAGDVEGLTLYHRARGGYLIASSQGEDKYTVLDRMPPHAPIGEFRLEGVGSTDGIDVVNVALGDAFPSGLFTAHNGGDCCPVVGASWSAVAEDAGLEVDVDGWSPRRGCDGSVGESSSGGEVDDGSDVDDGASADDGPADDTASDGGDAGSADDASASASASDTSDGSGDASSAGGTGEDANGCSCTAAHDRVAAPLLLVVIAALRRRR